jgi:hypothetical protein
MNYTITQAIKKLSNHSTTDNYFQLCRLIRDGIIHTCFDVYGVAVAVVEESNKPLPNKEVIGIRFLNENETLIVSPNQFYKNAICDLILDKIEKTDIPLVIDGISNQYNYVLLKGAKSDNIHLITSQLKDWHILVENPINLSEDSYTERQTTVKDLEKFNIYASFVITKLSLLITKKSLDKYLETLNTKSPKYQTVSDSYIEAKNYVAYLSDLCWEADSSKILTRTWIAEEIRKKLKGHKYEEELPEKDESLAKDWITQPKVKYSSNPGRRSKLEKERAKNLLKNVLGLIE